jgi:hypothetical protein
MKELKQMNSYEVLAGAREIAQKSRPWLNTYAKTIQDEIQTTASNTVSSKIYSLEEDGTWSASPNPKLVSQVSEVLEEVISEMEACDKLSLEELKDFSKVVLQEKGVFASSIKKLRKIQEELNR